MFCVLFGLKGSFERSSQERQTLRVGYEGVLISPRGELSYLAPLGSENISGPYFKQCFFGGGVLPPRQSNTMPPSPKTEITNILLLVTLTA